MYSVTEIQHNLEERQQIQQTHLQKEIAAKQT